MLPDPRTDLILKQFLDYTVPQTRHQILFKTQLLAMSHLLDTPVPRDEGCDPGPSLN